MTGRGTARTGTGAAGGFVADRPTETADTPESGALYAALERIFATPPETRAGLLADAVEAATAHLADLVATSREPEVASAALGALARIDRELGETLAALAEREL